MKISSIIFGSALSSIAALTCANAADIIGYKDAPAWAGFYAGANGGYGMGANYVLAVPKNGFEGLHPEGGFGGSQIGYNWQGGFGLGRDLVLGIEADIQGSGIQDKRTLQTTHVASALDWFGSVRGRLGYTFGSSLFYATGGLAYGGINNEFIAPASSSKNNGTATGFVIGGGYAYKFTPAWSLSAEYQYINLGRNDPAFMGASVCSSSVKCDDDAFHTVRFGVNYHLGTAYGALK